MSLLLNIKHKIHLEGPHMQISTCHTHANDVPENLHDFILKPEGIFTPNVAQCETSVSSSK